MTVYRGRLICRKCGIYSDWGICEICPYCGCTEGDRDE
jgi:hypothetical protein